MLEWLKTILGDSYTDEIDKQVSTEIGKSFVSKTDFNTKNEELKTANATIKTLQDAAKNFDGKDVSTLQNDLKNLQTKYDTDVANIRKDGAIDLALAIAKVKNTKAARAMLKLDAVTMDGDKLIGLDEQIKNMKETDPWMFDTVDKKTDDDKGDGTGMHVDTGEEHGTGGNAELDGVEAAFAKLNPGLKL